MVPRLEMVRWITKHSRLLDLNDEADPEEEHRSFSFD